MRAKNLLSELVLTVRTTELLGGSLIGDCDASLLLFVLFPDGLLVQLSILRLRVHVADLLHLQALLECLKLVEVLLLQHLPDQEPVQVVLLEAHLGLYRLLTVAHRHPR